MAVCVFKLRMPGGEPLSLWTFSCILTSLIISPLSRGKDVKPLISHTSTDVKLCKNSDSAGKREGPQSDPKADQRDLKKKKKVRQFFFK